MKKPKIRSPATIKSNSNSKEKKFYLDLISNWEMEKTLKLQSDKAITYTA